MQDRAAIASVSTSCPHTRARPDVGARYPVIIFIVVDLPAPFGPRKPSTSPFGTIKETSSTAASGPKYLTRCRISNIPARPAVTACLCLVLPDRAPRRNGAEATLPVTPDKGNPERMASDFAAALQQGSGLG